MTSNETQWLIGLSLFGAATGIVSGWLAARKSNGVENAFIRALLAAAGLPLLFCFVIGLFDAHQPESFSIVDAVLAGLGVMVYLGMGMAAFSVPASVVSAIASHAVFSRCCRKNKDAQSGPGE